MSFRRLFIAWTACLGFLAIAPTPAAAEPHVLKFAEGVDLTTLNPLVPAAAPNYELNYLTMAYLTRYGKGGRQPELLATLPTQTNGGISADGKTLTFKLRPGLKWSDGAPLTSADIAFSVSLILDTKTNSIYRDSFKEIVSVDTANSSTAVLHLSKPHGNALDDYFGSRSAPLLPKHLLDGKDFGTDAYQQLPAGAGPFRYARWLRGDQVVLEANPNYALGRPKLTKIVFKLIPNTDSAIAALRTGEIDLFTSMTYSEYAPLRDARNLKAQILTGVRPSLIAFNNQSPILQDPAVRRALLLATDRAAILRLVFRGAGILSETLVSSADPYQAKIALVPYDPKAADAAFDAAGWKRGPDGVRAKNGRRLHINIVAGSGAGFVDQELEIIRQTWIKNGIDLETRRLPLSMMFAPVNEGGILYGGKFDGAIFSQGEQKSNEFDGFLCSQIPPGGSNFIRLCSKPLDALILQQDRTYDARAQGKLGLAIQQLFASLTPEMVVTQRNEYDVYGESVTGYHRYPYAFFADPLALDIGS